MQRYVSRELTHFLGSHEQSEDDRYSLLVTILKTGILRSGPRSAGPGMGQTLITTPGAKFSDNEMYQPEVVCFCDIPVADFGIHMGKYSRFGISFLKSFLNGKNVRPVYYVPEAFAEGIDTLMAQYRKFFDPFPTNEQSGTPRDRRQRTLGEEASFWVEFHNFLEFEIFAFVKPFPSESSDLDEQNYYMEREWRAYGSIAFSLADVRRIILPADYASRLRADLPDYFAQITFADA